MRDYADVLLRLNRKLKQVHELVLKKDSEQAYLFSCDVTELAQELEDILQEMARFH